MSPLAGEHLLGGDEVPTPARRRRNARSNGTLVRVEIVIALVCSAVTLLGIVHLAARLSDDSSTAPQPQARGIVWGGRTFVDLATFARWLRSEGFSYQVWARRHPVRSGIASLLPPASQPAQGAPKASGAADDSGWLRWGLAGSAAVLAVLAVAAGIRRRDRLRQATSELPTEQLAVAARRGATAAAVGGRLVLRLANKFPAGQLAAAARRGAAAAAVGGPLLLRLVLRLAIVTTRFSWERIASVTHVVWRRRGELAWYVAAALFAAVSALALTMWA